MKCVRCNRPITAAAIWVGGGAIGPKCAKIMGLAKASKRTARMPPMKSNQPDQAGLFDELENEPCETE